MSTIEDGPHPPPRMCCPAVVRQILCGLAVSAGMLEAGMVVAWPAVLPDLQNDSTVEFNVTYSDVKWLVSCPSIVGMLTTMIAGPIIELVGPRLLMSLLLVPASGFWLLQCFSPTLPVFYLGRLGGGFIAAVFTTITNPLTAELVEPRLRGMVSSFPELVVSCGILVTYTLSYFLSWKVVTGLCAVPFLPLFAFSLLVPESPFWLVRKGRMREAEGALKSLRDLRKNVNRDELPSIQASVINHPQSTVKDQIKQLGVDHHIKPVLLLVSVFALREVGGATVVFSYAVYIFQKAGISLEPFLCTVLVGIIRLVSTGVSSLLVDRYGRKPFLFGALLVCGIAQTTGGAFLMADIPGANWMPLVAVLVFVFAYGVGVGPVPWVLLGELLPLPVRSIGASICTFSFCISQFTVGLFFPELMALAGLGGSFLIFAGANFVTSLIILMFLPETRGRSLIQLQEVFQSRQSTRSLIDVAASQEESCDVYD